MSAVGDVSAPNKLPVKVPEERLAAEFLANERTFLAWVRTSIAVISLGFVIAKLGIRASGPTGGIMIGFGGMITLLAAWRYHVVNRNIEGGTVTADRGLVILISLVVIVLSLVLIGYMVITNNP